MLLLVALALAGALVQASATNGAIVSGRVLELGTQAPVAGAQVVLATQLQGPPPGPFSYRPKTTTTDADGRFVFVDIEPGRYRLNAQNAGFAAPVNGGNLPSLELKSGDRIDNIALMLQRGGVITGRVVDQSGEPVVEARVMALRKPPVSSTPSSRASTVTGGARLANRLLPAGPSAQTNDLGEFRLHSLSSGEYYVQAAPRGNFGGTPSAASTAAVVTTMVPTYFPGTSDSGSAQPIFVTAGQTASDVVVRMVSASAFQVSGVVFDEGGEPVPNAMVRLMPQDPSAQSLMMSPFNQTRTDARGTFSLGRVTNGAYTLIAVPPVMIASQPQGAAGFGGGFTSFSTGASAAGGLRGGAVMTESTNGTTVQYRDDAGTQMPVVVSEGTVTGLQLIVRRPTRR